MTDDENTDVEDQGPASKQLTLNLLDRVALESRAYQRRHRRNLAAFRISTMGFNADESTIDLSTSENSSLLCPDQQAPQQESDGQCRLMKALPPLPKQTIVDDTLDRILNEVGQSANSSAQELERVSLNFGQIRSAKSASGLAKSSRNPLKFKLRMNTSTSSVESDCVPDGLKLTKAHGKSLDEDHQQVTTQVANQPPRLKLKISRSQLGHGKPPQNRGITRSNRLKQCNSLADVIQSSRSSAMRKALKSSPEMQPLCRDCSLDTISGSSPRADTSRQPSDQFNLSYPPSPCEAAKESHPLAASRRKSHGELRKAESDIAPMNQNRLRQKMSFLRVRIGGSNPAASPKSVQSVPVTRPDPAHGVGAMSEGANTTLDGYGSNSEVLSKSDKSDRVGGRVKRWASHAKLAVRSYMRRALVRSRNRRGEMEQL